jgi:hypothetical protein
LHPGTTRAPAAQRVVCVRVRRIFLLPRAEISATNFCMAPARAFIPALFLLASIAPAEPAPLPKINQLILDQIKQMPTGGRYSAHPVATIRLQSAAHFESGKFFVLPEAASPSYCSGATYLVFLKTIEQLRRDGALTLDFDTLNELMIRDKQKDGEGLWGRWNANGPGTARLFFELRLGKNFTELEKALPGDFMKIFWNREVGRLEHGHSVIFLGTEKRDGVDYVRYWSSNQPAGFGEKSVARSEIVHAIFSRLDTPANLTRIKNVPKIDSWLAGLLRNRSTFAKAKEKCGI